MARFLGDLNKYEQRFIGYGITTAKKFRNSVAGGLVGLLSLIPSEIKAVEPDFVDPATITPIQINPQANNTGNYWLDFLATARGPSISDNWISYTWHDSQVGEDPNIIHHISGDIHVVNRNNNLTTKITTSDRANFSDLFEEVYETSV